MFKKKIKKFLKKTGLYTFYSKYKDIKKEVRYKKSNFFLVSFPKCGRTWLTNILAKYYSYKYNIDFSLYFDDLHKQNKNIPDIVIRHFWSRERWRADVEILKKYKDKKIIFLLRDPRDVVISYFFQLTKRHPELYDEELDVPQEMGKFIRSDDFGIEGIIRYMNDIYKIRNKFKDFFLIKYGDLKESGRNIIKELLLFLEEDKINKDLINKSLEESKFEKMKQKEEKQQDDPKLSPGDEDDPESYKVRKGKKGGFRDYLDKEDIDFMNEKIDNRLDSDLKKFLFNDKNNRIRNK